MGLLDFSAISILSSDQSNGCHGCGHDWGEWNINFMGTKRVRKCKRCSAKEQKEL
jgi:hypothetical protein